MLFDKVYVIVQGLLMRAQTSVAARLSYPSGGASSPRITSTRTPFRDTKNIAKGQLSIVIGFSFDFP